MSKWGDRPHWRFAGVHVGQDAHGSWLGVPAGTRHARPGLELVSQVDTVSLVPRADAVERGYLATFHAPGIWCDTYVDIATPPWWDHDAPRPTLRSTDLDLDVVRRDDGSVFVDDEDEFAEHQVSLGYPASLVGAAERSCAHLHAQVLARVAPFDGGTAQRWLEALRALLSDP